ncbi:MAG: phosphoenolpyruvate hydrolase family protein [Pseudomonadota bacterium]
MTQTNADFQFGAVVGSGMTAQAADRSGADYLLALNAGRFRVQGASSLTCFLPIRDANAWVMEFAEREILGRVSAPVFAGLTVSDPSTNLDGLITTVQDHGFKGVCNFPPNALVSGRIRDLIEAEGLGFSRELEMVRRARDADLDALVYVNSNEQAHAMLAAGATTICANIGFTTGPTGIDSILNMRTMARLVDEVLHGLPSDFPTLCAGGPIITPEDAMAVWRNSMVKGYISGSTLDRLPIEQTLEEVANGFRMISRLSRHNRKINDAGLRLLGSSSTIQATNRDIADLAGETEPVMIVGEPGVGKSTTARFLYSMSDRANQRLSIVDCAGLEPNAGRIQLMGSARVSGHPSSRGSLEDASRGSVIFEAVESLSSDLQGQILRFVEDGTIQRIGDTDQRTVSVRILSTADQTVYAETAENRFRPDLYYKLAVHQLVLPPLRDRIEDLHELVDHFSSQYTKGEQVRFSNSALKMMMDYHWPGNVRELKNVVARAVRKARGKTVAQRDIEFFELPLRKPSQLSPALADPVLPKSESDWILAALVRHGWRRAKAAEDLGMSPRTLFNKIKKYGLERF